jgi:hypothetical protein
MPLRGYPELAIGTFNCSTSLPATASARRTISASGHGVQPQVPATACPAGTCSDLRRHPIMSDGQIELDGERLLMVEVVERKFIGDKVLYGSGSGRKLDVEVTEGACLPYRARNTRCPATGLAGLVSSP